jgi:hypothetical protein
LIFLYLKLWKNMTMSCSRISQLLHGSIQPISKMRTFQDLLDLTKASDVLQWLSPDPTSSFTNGTEPISWQCDLKRAPRRSTPRVRREDLRRKCGGPTKERSRLSTPRARHPRDGAVDRRLKRSVIGTYTDEVKMK